MAKEYTEKLSSFEEKLSFTVIQNFRSAMYLIYQSNMFFFSIFYSLIVRSLLLFFIVLMFFFGFILHFYWTFI